MRRERLIAFLSVTVTLLVLVTVALKFIVHKKTVFLILVTLNVMTQLTIMAFIVVKCNDDNRQRMLSTRETHVSFGYSYLHRVAGIPKKFSYKEVQVATGNFSSILGRGGAARVYKGILEDGTEVAVKVLEREDHVSSKGFKTEVAAIASVQHRNLVKLIGFCAHNSCKILVYEYVANGSLDNWIFDSRREWDGDRYRERVMPWSHRYCVAVSVAKALAYLHHDCRSKILHLDIKPENVLIDACFDAKLADFGISQLMGTDESRVLTPIRGTKGYLAPEWLLDNGVSEKCDVYSFGMLVFEIIGGRRNVTLIRDPGGKSTLSYFPKMVVNKVKEGNLLDIVDPRLPREFMNEEELRRLVMVSLWCIQEKSKVRPSMRMVVDMLEGRCVIAEPPRTRMIIVDLLSPDVSESSTGSNSSNDVVVDIKDSIPIAPRERENDKRPHNIRIVKSDMRTLSYNYSMESTLSPR